MGFRLKIQNWKLVFPIQEILFRYSMATGPVNRCNAPYRPLILRISKNTLVYELPA